jgi:hypothetical protein
VDADLTLFLLLHLLLQVAHLLGVSGNLGLDLRFALSKSLDFALDAAEQVRIVVCIFGYLSVIIDDTLKVLNFLLPRVLGHFLNSERVATVDSLLDIVHASLDLHTRLNLSHSSFESLLQIHCLLLNLAADIVVLSLEGNAPLLVIKVILLEFDDVGLVLLLFGQLSKLLLPF